MTTVAEAAGARELVLPLTQDRVLLVHGGGRRTLVVFGTHRMLRFLALAGYPEPRSFELAASAFDAEGAPLAARTWTLPADQELLFDSRALLGEGAAQPVEGSVLVQVTRVLFREPFDPALPRPAGDFNGVHLVHHAGRFVTGVHLYHGVDFRSGGFLARFYLRRFARRVVEALRDPLAFVRPRPWTREAVGASVVHSSGERGRGFVALHSDNAAPPASGFLEYRSESGAVTRSSLPALGAHATLRLELPPVSRDGSGEWGQVLCVMPPFGVSRFVTGERFADGRLTFDHNYFQQLPTTTEKVSKDVRYFDKALLSDRIVGPSHPWPLIHDARTESLIAMCKQFDPARPHVYDLRVYDNDGRLALESLEAVRVAPYGVTVFNVSQALRARGIEKLEGTYFVSHSRANAQDRLPNRIHAQGVYRFDGLFWNSVQSDASIWASPEPKVPGIEALSAAKIRRKQYWFAPVIESDDLETLIGVSNLSYSLDYDQTLTLGLRYTEGTRVVAEKEITLKPFGAALLRCAELFGGAMTRRPDGFAAGSVTIYPKTGITYCASFLVRDKRTGIFMIEHVLPLPKFPHEVAS